MTGIAAKRSADTANRRCAGKAITPQDLLLNSLKAGERVEWWVLALLVYQKSNKCSIHLLDKYNRAYDVVYTNFVGEIVYEDKWQIAVKVEEGRMI